MTPSVSRVYRNHHLDSTRWELYLPQAGDVVVTTAYKAGTTWTQLIVLNLLHLDAVAPMRLDASPWPDRRLRPSREELETQLRQRPAGRRLCLKSHLPLDGLPYFEGLRYIVVGRDARDVFMSLFNHYRNYTDDAYALLNGSGCVGPPLPRCPEDPCALWRDWITHGWFPWESEGYPFWSNMRHTQSYWDFRHLPNLLFVHYADLLRDPHGGIARIARFIDVDVGPAQIARVEQSTRFDTLKANAIDHMPHLETLFAGGADSFFFKGGNGRWRDVLTHDDIELYAAACERVLERDCARWLERGDAG